MQRIFHDMRKCQAFSNLNILSTNSNKAKFQFESTSHGIYFILIIKHRLLNSNSSQHTSLKRFALAHKQITFNYIFFHSLPFPLKGCILCVSVKRRKMTTVTQVMVMNKRFKEVLKNKQIY
jgi:hypothetical protein